MGLPSTVHNGLRMPLKCDSGLSRVSQRSQTPKWNAVHFLQRPIAAYLCTGIHFRRALYHPIVCCKRTDQEDIISTSGTTHNSGREWSAEGKRTNALPPDDNDDVRTSHDCSSTGIAGETQEQKAYASSIRTVALCVCTAVAFGIGIGFKDGVGKASEFFAGYILEQSLSVDNLFVFVLIFKYFKVPIMHQNRVLSYGIAGAVVFRLTIILLGTATLQSFEAVNLLLAAILLFSSFKLFSSEEDDTDLSNNFVVKICQKFIPVTTYYDGDRFITNQNGLWKV